MSKNSCFRAALGCFAVWLSVAGGTAYAQSYSFSTAVALPFGGNSQFPASSTQIADAQALAASFAGSSVSGSFVYDATTPAFVTNSDGSVIYAANPNSSFRSFSATISGGSLGTLSISDPRGFTQIGNETFGPVGSKVDIFQFFADSSSPAGTNHNISGFSLGAFSLYNVRLFWIEGQTTPETVPDLFSTSALPGAPPGMHGRMALDFVKDGITGGQTYVVFFDGVQVAAPIPEPETYAMMLAGLGLLAVYGRRRKLAAETA